MRESNKLGNYSVSSGVILVVTLLSVTTLVVSVVSLLTLAFLSHELNTIRAVKSKNILYFIIASLILKVNSTEF